LKPLLRTFLIASLVSLLLLQKHKNFPERVGSHPVLRWREWGRLTHSQQKLAGSENHQPLLGKRIVAKTL